MNPIKAAILSVIVTFTCGMPFAQTATIPNRVYKINEDIRATITAPASKAINMGVYNDLARASQNYPLAKGASQTIVLGRATSPGQYLVRFLTAEGFDKTFLIFVLPASSTYSTADLVKEVEPVKGVPAKYMTNMRGLTEAQWKNIHARTFNKYLQKHVVSATTTFVICVTAVAQPTLWITCGSSVAGNAKDYAMDMLEEAAAEMKTAGTLTQAEFNTVKTALAATEFAFSLFTSFRLDGKKIKIDGIELFSGSSQFAAKVSTEKEELEAGTTMTAEFAKKVDMLIKIGKKIP